MKGNRTNHPSGPRKRLNKKVFAHNYKVRDYMLPDMYRGGNTHRGADRKGYRGGRKPIYPKGTEVIKALVILSDAEAAVSMYIGQGNISRGIRRALAFAKPHLAHCPENRDAAYAMAKQTHIGAVRADIVAGLGLQLPLIPTSGYGRLGAAVDVSKLNVNVLAGDEDSWDDVPETVMPIGELPNE